MVTAAGPILTKVIPVRRRGAADAPKHRSDAVEFAL